ncbi:MAG: hypothetical protein M1821_000560 [Bathelium mastoideum]|nr:MAG: hypothetical protein M1821_000560 [Bathelium mastoideum]
MASALSSAQQPTTERLDGSLRELHVKETVAKDGGQAFAVVDLGKTMHAATKTPQVSSTDKLKEWQDALFLTNPEDDRAELTRAKGRRVEHTCEWIKSSDTFLSWLQGNTPLLWISGRPGRGKTMLSIFLTEELERGEARDLHILYYFCSRDDEKRNNTVYILRGLLWQLMQKPGVEDLILQHLTTEEENSKQLLLSSRESLWRLFVAITRDPALGRVCCVLDGLDECDNESTHWPIQKLNALATTVAERSSNEYPRLIVISRELPSMTALVANTRWAQIRLNADQCEQVNDDIGKMISALKAQNILFRLSEGTFSWVRFVMNALEREATVTGVLQKLRGFLKGPNVISKGMLPQIDHEDQRHQPSLVLRWLTLVDSPLPLTELAAAIQNRKIASMVEEGSGDQHILIGPDPVGDFV